MTAMIPATTITVISNAMINIDHFPGRFFFLPERGGGGERRATGVPQFIQKRFPGRRVVPRLEQNIVHLYHVRRVYPEKKYSIREEPHLLDWNDRTKYIYCINIMLSGCKPPSMGVAGENKHTGSLFAAFCYSAP